MKRLIGIILILAAWTSPAISQPMERVIQSVPVFAAVAGVKADNGVLKMGLYSEVHNNIDDELELFQELKSWNHSKVQQETGHNDVEVVFLKPDNLKAFDGQIIWVLAADKTLPDLKAKTESGVFSIGANDREYEKFIFATLTYENKSDDPKIERWRLTRLHANCLISDYRFPSSVTGKDHFVGTGCD